MEKNKTARGFGNYTFKDRYNANCSLQKSSIATEDCIWLGVDECNPQKCVSGKGWVSVPFPEDTLFTTRMHLTQDQVKELLPILKKFVKTGEI